MSNVFLDAFYWLATGGRGSGENKEAVVAAKLAQFYYEGMENEELKVSERKACADAVADRVYGKAVQAMDVNSVTRMEGPMEIRLVLKRPEGGDVIDMTPRLKQVE